MKTSSPETLMNPFPLNLIAQFDGVEVGGQCLLSLTEEKQSSQSSIVIVPLPTQLCKYCRRETWLIRITDFYDGTVSYDCLNMMCWHCNLPFLRAKHHKPNIGRKLAKSISPFPEWVSRGTMMTCNKSISTVYRHIRILLPICEHAKCCWSSKLRAHLLTC